MKPRFIAVLGVCLSLSPRVTAYEGVFHPELLKELKTLDQSRGAETYTALRKLWDLWDRAEPAHIEEALASYARRPDAPAEARAYASTLSALARARRGDLKAAHSQIQKLGFVGRWFMLGPFDNEGKGGFAPALQPELEFAEPLTPGKSYPGKERAVRTRALPEVFPLGLVNAAALLQPHTKICTYATTFVQAKDKKPRTASIWVGATGAFKLFWNGKSVLEDAAYRNHDFDRSVASVKLGAGANLLTLKVCGDESTPIFSVRLADAKGAPDAGLEVSNDFALSREAAAQKAEPALKSALQGPLQRMERSLQGKPSAEVLENAARYLFVTSGDDPALHQARDLSQRAADSAPSLERLFLAGALAEDHNQQAQWLGKAEELAAKNKQTSTKLLVARALERRASPNFRQAFGYFERALKLDADDVLALRGNAELYNMAGLPRTAESFLSNALNRRPNSVNLLNMFASELRTLGRSIEAAEAEDRYFALRFDDGGYLSSMIDVAVAARNRAAAERWIDRLLASHPSSVWALGVAAGAYRALGQAERAQATYRRALELSPEDVATLRRLAELEGELGHHNEQLALLQEILKIRPQNREVRDYVEHLGPEKPRPDEAYAWDPQRFLGLRKQPRDGETKRVLRDLTVSTVFENGLSSQFRQVVFQPLTDSAASDSRQYGFAYEADRQVVQLRGARVFRPNGRVDEAIESGEAPSDDPSIAMYTSSRSFFVEFPRLDAGDVVELRYRVDDVTPRNDYGNYFGEVNYLQSTEPVANAEYVLITPQSRTLYIDQNIPGLKGEVNNLGNQRIYRFFAHSLPAILPEPAMAPIPEVLGFVHASTFKNWEELGSWYTGFVKDQFDLDEETRKLARQITKGKTTDLEKVQAVYEWVTKNTRYVALEFGVFGYKPHRCVQTVARGWGDCKDKATVIVTLLRELNIEADFIVLRTQMRGDFRSKIASLAPFDHAIAYVPSLNLYLDGTAEYTGIHELPRMDLNSTAIRIRNGRAEPVRLPGATPEQNLVKREIRATLAANGEAKLDMDYSTFGYNAADWRRQYHADATRKERLNRDLSSEFTGIQVSQVTTSNLNNAEEPVKITLHATAPAFARKEGAGFSMSVTGRARLTPHYASLSERKYDVYIGGYTSQEDTYVVKLPAGMKVVSTPTAQSADTPFGSYSVAVQVEADKVTVKSSVALKVSRVLPQDYRAWQAFCRRVDQALNNRLVIE